MLNSTVRGRLVQLVLAIMVPTVVAALGAIYYVYEEKQRQFEGSLAEATRALSLVVEQEIGRREAIVRTLALSPTLDAGDLRAFYEYARTVAPSPETVVVLSDLSGQQVVNTRRPFGDPTLPRSQITLAQVQQAPGGTLVTDVYYAPIGKQYSFAVTVPVMRNGRPKYVLSFAGYASALQGVFEDQRFPRRWVASVLDRKGVVVARNIEPARYVGRPASDRLRAQLAAGRSGQFRSVALDGTEILASFSTAPDFGWTVVVGVPLDEVGSPFMAAARFALIATILFIAALLGAVRVGRGLVRPVDQARDAAERIARAEPVHAQSTGLQEMDTVLKVLAATSVSVQDASAQMQARVQQALAEADKAHQAVLQNQRLEALGQLTGGVAHDFNNLLMVVNNYAHLLRARRPELAGTQELAGIERAVATGSKLTRQLLAFARRQPLRPEQVDLQTRLPEVAALLKASLGSRIVLTCEVAPDTRPVRVDPAEFELALINLAVNARDAMPDGGTLRVSAANAADGMVSVAVADSGNGIPADLLAKVFEPFFTTKPVGHGTGLGLSQVYGFARQANGHARIESVEGQGTRVILLLPAVDDIQDARPDADADGSFAATQALRVLLVEDNNELAAVTAQVLAAAGHDVTRVESGDRARESLRDGGAWDIVLSDIRMPGSTDGIQLARWLQAERPGLPVVLMTGYSSELEQARLLGLDVLPKPSTPAALLEAIARACSRAGERDAEVRPPA